jgi:membrane protein implicated in regulation of membrane protease activity
MSDISTILNACELVWRQQSIDTATIAEMRGELESHLLDAQAAGKPLETVVGANIDHFARSWAQPERTLPANLLIESRNERQEAAARTRARLFVAIGAAVAVTALSLLLGPKGSGDDLRDWQWLFVGGTFALLIGELLVGGFFMLPFGIGAGAASLLSFANVEPPMLIFVFIVVSVLSLWGLRELASKDDDVVFAVGADRYTDQTAIVTEAIHGIGSVGRVRVETESWMAITDGNERIDAGSVVRIREVRGARLVVTAN